MLTPILTNWTSEPGENYPRQGCVTYMYHQSGAVASTDKLQ
jgi:hypothetical protein